MAPASSWEKERHSGSFSAKKLETRVMGPGLAPNSPAKRASMDVRGGRVSDGREGTEEDKAADGDDEATAFSAMDEVGERERSTELSSLGLGLGLGFGALWS